MENSHPNRLATHPLVFCIRTLFSVYVALLLRLIALSPLLCLVLFPAGSPLQYWALLCPLLILFLILPLRFSFAQAISQNPFKAAFSFDTCLSLSSYFAKLKASLFHGLRLLIWSLPFLGASGACYYFFQNGHSSTRLNAVEALGNQVLILAEVFFGEAVAAANVSSGLLEGFYAIGGILGVFLLIFAYGTVRNSAYRYIWAISLPVHQNPRAENRLWLRKRWLLQVGVGLINFLLLLPFLLRLKSILTPLISDISFMALLFASGSIITPSALFSVLLPLLIAFLGLYLPLLAVRRMITAFFVTQIFRPGASTAPVSNPKDLPSAEDTDFSSEA